MIRPAAEQTEQLNQRNHITEADILRLIAAAFVFGVTVGILITPALEAITRTNP
jgi:hypothetical protein